MPVYDAKVADILRLSQRDADFVRDIENQINTLCKFMGTRHFHNMRKVVPALASAWYYLMTSMTNLQTLGEEYTGTIRVIEGNQIPTKLLQISWLVFYIGGEPLLERLLKSIQNKVSKSAALRPEAKESLLKCVELIKEHTSTLKRIHHAIFYVTGKYYTIPNRITGIRYALLRQWLQDDTFTGSFKILGNLFLFYILFDIVYQILTIKSNAYMPESIHCSSVVSSRMCILCAENIKTPCATPCGHIFCWACIFDSLNYQKACPFCRESVTPNRIIFLQNYV